MKFTVIDPSAPTSVPIVNPILKLEGNSSDVDSVAFSPGGQTLAVGASDGAVCLWRAR